MSITRESFTEFLARRLAASTDFLNGDIEPLHAISAATSPATIFGPRGNTVEGAEKVNAVNAEGAARFDSGSTNAFEVMHQDADEGLAYWVGIQRSVVRLRGQEQPVPMDLRVTEIFRRDHGGWVLIHRHADPLATSTE